MFLRSWVALGVAVLLCACAKRPAAVVQPSAPAVPREPATRTDCAEGFEWDGTGCAEVAASIPEEPVPLEPAPPPERLSEPALPSEAEAQPIQPIPSAAPNPPLPTQPVAPSTRDPRKLATAPRAQPLLITEIQALERLYAVTPRASPDRVLLLRRLAEAYVELEYSVARGTDAKSAKVLVAARKKAIEHYRRVVTDYPRYARLDEIVYYLGYEYERAGDTARARAMYRKLTTEFPSSSYLLRLPKKR